MNGYEVIHEKSPAFYDLYERKGELQQQTHYCPGCGHGIVHKLIAEALTDLGEFYKEAPSVVGGGTGKAERQMQRQSEPVCLSP